MDFFSLYFTSRRWNSFFLSNLLLSHFAYNTSLLTEKDEHDQPYALDNFNDFVAWPGPTTM